MLPSRRGKVAEIGLLNVQVVILAAEDDCQLRRCENNIIYERIRTNEFLKSPQYRGGSVIF